MKRNRWSPLLLSLVGAALAAPTLSAQCDLGEQAILFGSTSDKFDHVGSAVGLSGTVAAVGASWCDDIANYAGAVFLFEYDGSDWNETDVLYASDAEASDYFAAALDLEDEVLAVGAALEDTGGRSAGAVYVFRDSGSGFVEEEVLYASDASANDKFGDTVVLDGDLLAIGAPGADGADSGSGAVYLFRFHSGSGAWVEEDKIYPSSGATSDKFGDSIALDDEVLVVGAPKHDSISSEEGAAYVYRYNGGTGTWSLEQKLSASDGATGDLFGDAVAVAGDLVAVGASNADLTASNEGAVYTFRESGGTWTEEEKITAESPRSGESYGEVLAMDEETIFVGAPTLASSYVLRYGRQTKLVGSDTQISDTFASSIALDGELALVGSPAHDDLGLDAGAAYVFHVPEIALVITPDSVSEGDDITVTACGGQDGGLLLLYLMEINDSPFILRMTSGLFDSDGHWSLGPVTTPPGLAGLSTAFQVFGIAASGRADGSNIASLTFE